MRRIGRIDHVNAIDAAGVFLADALEHAFGAAALDTDGDAGKGGLERFRNLLCQW